jgi:hypothetical protein
MKQQLARSQALMLLVCSALLPWLITIGSINAIEQWLPGQVKVDHWRNVSSASFIVGAGLSVYALLNLGWHRVVRIITATILILISLWFALMVQLRSNCGDEEIYIGESGKAAASSCE